MPRTREKLYSEDEARLLILIGAFSRGSVGLVGRTKLAKLDFFLRYPAYLRTALRLKAPDVVLDDPDESIDVESRMIRYRFGPWDPKYFLIISRLVGTDLIEIVETPHGMGFKENSTGKDVLNKLVTFEDWAPTFARAKIVKQHFDLSGKRLKEFIYGAFPEIVDKRWGEAI